MLARLGHHRVALAVVAVGIAVAYRLYGGKRKIPTRPPPRFRC